jgi:hypothetical protein
VLPLSRTPRLNATRDSWGLLPLLPLLPVEASSFPSRRPPLDLNNIMCFPSRRPRLNATRDSWRLLPEEGSTCPSRRPLLNSFQTPLAFVPMDAPVEAPSTRSDTGRTLGLGFVEAPSSRCRMGVSSLLPHITEITSGPWLLASFPRKSYWALALLASFPSRRPILDTRKKGLGHFFLARQGTH